MVPLFVLTGSEDWSMMGDNLFGYHDSVRFFRGGKLRIALILFLSGLTPSGGQVSPKKVASFALKLKFVWTESQIVFPRCVEDVKYALVMLCLTHTIDECQTSSLPPSHSSLPKTISNFLSLARHLRYK